MWHWSSSSWRRALYGGVLAGCAAHPTATVTPSTNTPNASKPRSVEARDESARGVAAPATPLMAQTDVATPSCQPADWSATELGSLLVSRRLVNVGTARRVQTRPDQTGALQTPFAPECMDAPGPIATAPASSTVVAGVELRVVSARPAGKSGRGWAGNQCAFELRLADGSGVPVRLGERAVPPFNAVNALVRAGSAVWLELSFNGYTAEFPGGGNRVVALDLCEGRVLWQSEDAIANGGLLLLGDYLVAPFGFTRERRFVHVLAARSGKLLQKLPVIENICPSESWAPHWHAGERCDAPGQAVGAATNPRVKDGLLLVDTNTGSAAFEFEVGAR